MPLGSRTDYKDARFCGLVVDSPVQLVREVDEIARPAGFDFVSTPLAAHNQRRHATGRVLDDEEFRRSDMVLDAGEWSNKVVGLVSSWLDLDSDDAGLRRDSAAAMTQELDWARHMGLQAVLLSPPRTTQRACCYAQVLNSALKCMTCMAVWIRLPYSAVSSGDGDVWQWWHTVRSLCRYNSLLGVCLEVGADLPEEAFESRWLAEPIKALLLPTAVYTTNRRGFPVLTKPHQRLVNTCFSHGIQMMVHVQGDVDSVLGVSVSEAPTPAEASAAAPALPHNTVSKLRTYWEYLSFLFQKMPELEGLDLFEFAYRDHPQLPLQPLSDNLENATYETFERDRPKYDHYQEAIRRALVDCSSGAAAGRDVAVCVVGAGRGPLVQAALQASQDANVPVQVWAVEKNPNAVALLRQRLKDDMWHGRVTLVPIDMRSWVAPQKIDIMVSELLGSFGDNELSPECLDGAQACLAAGGVSIPSSYTSYLAPIATHTVYAQLIASEKPDRFEVPMVCKLSKHAVLCPPQPVFTFHHPNRSEKIDNARHTACSFHRHASDPHAVLHGFAGYFTAVLYKDVQISTNPDTHTPDMHSWFPLYFPITTPVTLQPGDGISVDMWRLVGGSKVWYEWALSQPGPSALHNSSGEKFFVGLDLEERSWNPS